VSWTPEASALVERSIERYGGRARWERIRRITLASQTLSGFLLWLKGLGKTFPMQTRMDVEPRRQRLEMIDFPAPGHRGVYEAGRVALDDAPLAEHRAQMPRGRWQPIDSLYFFGYAVTHYHSMPFTLPEATLRRFDARRRTITVEFPAQLHTHCPVQTIHFDESGLIVRHDYVAEVIGRWARGAHHWNDYVTVEGFPIATHRHVVPLLGPFRMGLNALDARFSTPAVEFD
jgi:hypothetical protein